MRTIKHDGPADYQHEQNCMASRPFTGASFHKPAPVRPVRKQSTRAYVLACIVAAVSAVVCTVV